MENAETTLKITCRTCGLATKHEILHAVEHAAEASWFNELHSWQIIRCLGCESLGFRYRIDDFDDIEENPLSGKKYHAVKVHRYPPSILGHRELDSQHVIPELIRKVYRQTISAYAGDAWILAGIGFRATIEAVCTHLQVSGASLEKRIDSLFRGGHISSSDKRRLHAIRFLGNDAAHEIREPKKSELKVALEIVEHLISSCFILGHKAKDMDLPIDSFEDFEKLLRARAKSSDSDQPQSVASILGRDKRRLGPELPLFDSALVKAVNNGAVKFLALDSVEKVEGKDVQLYKIVRSELSAFDFDDDIPF
ncbi:DUF4145 domain-containing protein [Variovorax sp. 38R]|uniref:DUF4145 domain-containing protein n=1 Tax=Variovorax sp. 38R TaxID=2774875 RepID=UPI0017802223|nr:DUF4145 domain-containing protein [Variovorax sp. 38R]QOF76054.1 DUF4145 domain-containing protein [Variovorax sp. 38R]